MSKVNINSAWRIAVASLTVAAALLLGTSTTPAQAGVEQLTLHRRSCGGVTGYVNSDGFGVGAPPYAVVFAADTDGDGVYGEANDGIRQVAFKAAGRAVKVNGRMNFPAALPEGTKVSVVAYQVDNDGVIRSGVVGPVSFACTSRVETLPFSVLDGNVGNVKLATTLVVYAEATQVYTEPNIDSTVLGGLGKGQRITVTGINVNGDWVSVDFNGQTGWVLWRTYALVWGPRASLTVGP